MNRNRLLTAFAIVIAFSLVSGVLGAWVPSSSCAFLEQADSSGRRDEVDWVHSIYSLDRPLLGCLLTLAAWTLLRVLVYPVLFVFALYYASKGPMVSRMAIVSTLIVASFVGALLEILTTRQMSILLYAPPDRYFNELFWFFLPQTVLTVSVTRFFLALGALALRAFRVGSD